MAQKYIVVKDEVIQAVFHTSDGIKGIERSIENLSIEHDKILEVPENFEGHKNQNINEFCEDWKLKKVSERKDYIKIPENYKIDGEDIIPMTLQERVESGIETIPVTMKAVDNDLVPKTENELIIEGIKTQKEIDEENTRILEEKLIFEEIRKIAINNLGSKLEIIKE